MLTFLLGLTTLAELDAEKQKIRDDLRKHSGILTDSSITGDDPPHNKYTLRGLCTAPHIIYVLRKDGQNQSEVNLIEMEESQSEEWHWWRISFSADDAKTQKNNKPKSRRGRNRQTNNADVIGHTAIRVREVEVLRAARDARSLLLVYANQNAIGFPQGPAPPALQVCRYEAFFELGSEAYGCPIATGICEYG